MSYQPNKANNAVGQVLLYGLTAAAVGILPGGPMSSLEAKAQGVQKTSFSLPKTSEKGIKYLGSKPFDAIDNDIAPGAETTVRYFEKPDKTRFATFTLKNDKGAEKIFAYNIDLDGRTPFEYSLVDITGKGDFVRQPVGRFQANGWIEKFFKG